jgi:hypothetical protein
MGKKLIFVGALILIIFSVYLIIQTIYPDSAVIGVSDPQKVWAIIDGKYIGVNNTGPQSMEENSPVITTRIFGKPVFGDISGDGKDDAVFFMTYEGSGSGVFFYAVAAKKTDTGWVGMNSILLGDRIAPQNINIVNGVANFNYADRKANEPFTTQPSVGVTKRFVISGSELREM